MALRPAFRHILIGAVVAMLVAGCASRDGAQSPERSSDAAAPPAAPTVEPNSAPPAPREAQPPVQAAPPAAATRSTQAATDIRLSVAETQRKLTDLGYRPGPVDGVMGARTAAALRDFQRDQGLRQSGQLDADTNQRLRAAQRR